MFTPQQLQVIQGVGDDIARQAATQGSGRVGSNTFQNLATNAILQKSLPGPVMSLVGGRSGPVATAAGKVGNLVYGGANDAVRQRMLDMMLDPKSGLTALNPYAALPAAKNPLMQRLAPYYFPAAPLLGTKAGKEP